MLATSLTGDLPRGTAAVFAHASPEPSRLLAADGSEVTSFALVEAIEPAEVVPPELVEAFLSAAEPSFYEARASRATPLVEALRRAAAGAAPSASRLSTELARLLLEDEPPGLRRRIREEILATRLDAEETAAARSLAWLEWVPLCDGHRGLQRAAADCLGVPVEAWGTGEIAAVAAAAAGGLDLADPSDVLVARRDAVVDRMIVQGGLDPVEAVRLPAPKPRVAPRGTDAWLREALAETRRRAGHVEPAPVVAWTHLRPSLQGRLEAIAQDGAWAALDPRTGGILALGGDATAPGGALDRAVRTAALLRADGEVRARHLARVEVVGAEDVELAEPAAYVDPRPTIDRLEELRPWSDAYPVRWLRDGDNCVRVAHPHLALAVCGYISATAVADLGARLPAEAPAIPDDAWLGDDGRLVRRDGKDGG